MLVVILCSALYTVMLILMLLLPMRIGCMTSRSALFGKTHISSGVGHDVLLLPCSIGLVLSVTAGYGLSDIYLGSGSDAIELLTPADNAQVLRHSYELALGMVKVLPLVLLVLSVCS